MFVSLWMLLGDVTPPPAESLEGNKGMWPLVGGLLGFVAILALSYFGLRYMSRRNLLSARGRHLQVVDRMAVGRDSTILLVRVADKVLVTGVGKEGFNTLCEMSAAELETEEPERPAVPSVKTSDGFWGRFWHNLKVSAGLLPKGTPLRRPERDEPTDGETPSAFGDVLRRSQEELADDADSTQSAAPQAAPKKPTASKPTGIPQKPVAPQPVAPQPVAPQAVAASQATAAPQATVAPDYNSAIERMKAFGRMEIEAQTRTEPTAMDNLAFLQAARAYAAQQQQQKSEQPVLPKAERPDGVVPARPEPVPARPGAMESLSDRIQKRTRRLSHRMERGGGNALS